MSWLERPERKSVNPAAKFLQWKSEEGKFSYYDKEKKENISIDLPFKFVILEHFHTVKGWHDSSESGIYSNEVFSIGTEPLTVKAFKGGTIASGLYKDNKTVIKEAGGHYSRSIYAVTNDLEIVNISIKGSAVSAYSDFIKEFGDGNFDQYWIAVSEAKPMKKGKINYTIPVFKKSTAIKDKSKLAPFAKTLGDYINDYNEEKSKDIEVKEPEVVNAENDGDELAF